MQAAFPKGFCPTWGLGACVVPDAYGLGCMDEALYSAYPPFLIHQPRVVTPPLLQERFRVSRHDDEEVGSTLLRRQWNAGISRDLRHASEDKFAPITRQTRHQRANRQLPT